MGGRKQRRPVRTRPLPTIPKIFDCPRCEATAIRISLESDLAVVECGSCHLKQTVTEIKAIEEAIDIYGNFLDLYYQQIESFTEESMEQPVSTPSSQEEVTESADEPQLEEPTSVEETLEEKEEAEEEEVEEEEPQVGFIPRAKGDVLKKKQKPKGGKKKNIVDLSSFKD